MNKPSHYSSTDFKYDCATIGFIFGFLCVFFSEALFSLGFLTTVGILLTIMMPLSEVLGSNDAGWLALFIIYPLAMFINGVVYGGIGYGIGKLITLFIKDKNP
jgi:hypothetical protein